MAIYTQEVAQCMSVQIYLSSQALWMANNCSPEPYLDDIFFLDGSREEFDAHDKAGSPLVQCDHVLSVDRLQHLHLFQLEGVALKR